MPWYWIVLNQKGDLVAAGHEEAPDRAQALEALARRVDLALVALRPIKAPLGLYWAVLEGPQGRGVYRAVVREVQAPQAEEAEGGGTGWNQAQTKRKEVEPKRKEVERRRK